MPKALKQKQEYGIPLSRYTVFLQNCPLGHDPKWSDFSLQTHKINYFLLGLPFIGISLFNEYIILFRNLLKLVNPLADFRIELILELVSSIGPLESLFSLVSYEGVFYFEFLMNKKFSEVI